MKKNNDMNNRVESIFYSLKSKEEKLKYLLPLFFSEPKTETMKSLFVFVFSCLSNRAFLDSAISLMRERANIPDSNGVSLIKQ